MTSPERQVSLFRNGRSQALRIFRPNRWILAIENWLR